MSITFIVLKIVFMIMYLPVDAGMYKVRNLLMYSNQAKQHNQFFFIHIPTTPVEVCDYKMYPITSMQ